MTALLDVLAVANFAYSMWLLFRSWRLRSEARAVAGDARREAERIIAEATKTLELAETALAAARQSAFLGVQQTRARA